MTGINPIVSPSVSPVQPISAGAPTARVDGDSNFGNAITGAIQSVSDAEREADQLAVAVASGQETSVSDLMIATSKATLSVELMAQVRNRAVEAYQEIMRMQV